MADNPATPGEHLRSGERKIGTTIRTIVANYYGGVDNETAEAIRRARSSADATQIVTAMRRGRTIDVLALAASGVAGFGVGMLVQRELDVRIGPVPPLAAAGLLAVVAAAVTDASLLARGFIAVGGAAYATGSYAYTRMKGQP